MIFQAGWWPLALAVWLAVVLLLLWGRLRRVKVPFLPLWQGPEAKPRDRRALEVPPLSLLLAMLALLLAALACAGPAIRGVPAHATRLTVVIDRGASMSARIGQLCRFQALASRLAPLLRQSCGPGPLDLHIVPGPAVIHTDRDTWASQVLTLAPTAADTGPAMRSMLPQLLARSPEMLILLTDQEPALHRTGLLWIAPDSHLENVGFAAVAARLLPVPQLMVRIRNQSSRSRADLRVLADTKEVLRLTIDLPPAGPEEHFLSLPFAPRTLVAELVPDDDMPADNRVYLVRQPAWPHIVPCTSLPPELQRLIEAYSASRPASPDSKAVQVQSATTDRIPDSTAVLLAEGIGAGASAGPGTSPSVMEHPITRWVSDWKSCLPASGAPEAPPGTDWIALVRHRQNVLLAARERPARQVWVGFCCTSWSASPDFVVLWTNILDWLGEGAEMMSFQAVQALGASWAPADPGVVPANLEAGLWPGIYRSTGGRLCAVNALDVRIPDARRSDWPAEIERLAARADRREDRHLAAPLLLGSLGLLVASAALWRRSSSTRTGTKAAWADRDSMPRGLDAPHGGRVDSP